ncbi:MULTISPECIES: DUF397 domain-containing protein [unclassified Streptomyces]|uniref:DUF397 domain-containing protein n=1 Tax=unclassified Streptomyces TaxID=2593676 RepID=UPI002E2D1978|nr:DUF397 domain-containing protein [Streptomyces sp. NBC_00223]
MTDIDLSGATWFKSSHSGNGGSCVEISSDFPGVIPVRDSKVPDGPALIFPAAGFAAFVEAVKAGEFGTV